MIDFVHNFQVSLLTINGIRKNTLRNNLVKKRETALFELSGVCMSLTRTGPGLVASLKTFPTLFIALIASQVDIFRN